MEIGIGIGIEIAYSHLRDCQSFLLPVHHLQELHDLGILRATPFLVSGEFLGRCRLCGDCEAHFPIYVPSCE
jgi:hypothetical protein